MVLDSHAVGENPLERDIGKVIRPIEMNVSPLQRGKVLLDLLWHRYALVGQNHLGLLKITGIPDCNGVVHQRER